LDDHSHPYSIGDLSKLSGVSTLCIRVWESRHGFPIAVRLPSGHRRYSKEDLLRLQLIAQAQELGHRIGKLSKSSIEELREMIDQTGSVGSDLPILNDARFSQILEDIKNGHFGLLKKELTHHLDSMGLLDFLEQFALPFLDILGRHWQDGQINVAHEHQASLELAFFLEQHWRSVQVDPSAEKWVVAGLVGDHHCIALSMVACLLAKSGKNVIFLGPRNPTKDLMDFIDGCKPQGLCISVSISTSPQIINHELKILQRFCRQRNILLRVGGAGAHGSEFCSDLSLSSLAEFIRQAR